MFFKTAISVGPVLPILYLRNRFGWSCVGLLRQSSEVGPGYYLYLEGLVGFDKGHWVVSLFYQGQESLQC